MIFAALSEAADRGELVLVQDGLLHYHQRRDGVIVIREVLVLPFARGGGVGGKLLQELKKQFPGAPMLARCPLKYERAQGFWAKQGFQRVGEERGCAIWRLS